MTNARVMQVATSLNSALANYYKKSEVYNKSESNGRFSRHPDYARSQTISVETDVEKTLNVTEDGFITCFLLTWGGLYVYLKINDVTLLSHTVYSNSFDVGLGGQFDVSVGDVVKIKTAYRPSYNSTHLVFTPYKE